VTRLVLDASTVLTWCFPDEECQKSLQISERIANGERVVVPPFWRHEILNALLVGEKRKRLTPDLTWADGMTPLILKLALRALNLWRRLMRS